MVYLHFIYTRTVTSIKWRVVTEGHRQYRININVSICLFIPSMICLFIHPSIHVCWTLIDFSALTHEVIASNWHLLFACRLFLVYPKAIIRSTIVIVNNLYCIPTYTLWMILLLPLRWFNRKLYYKIEGKFFHWLLTVVTMWSWSAGYDGKAQLIIYQPIRTYRLVYRIK